MTLANVKLFFSPPYLFNAFPGYDMKLLLPIFIFFVALVLLSIISYILARKNRKKPIRHIWVLLYNWYLYGGIVGLFLLACRYEGVAYLSMRFLMFAWLATIVIWGFYIIWFYLKPYKKIVKEAKEKEVKEKYLKRKK